jgi:membrane protease YdiL (CAAX protease family)
LGDDYSANIVSIQTGLPAGGFKEASASRFNKCLQIRAQVSLMSRKPLTELLLVLGVSLGSSAIYSVLSLLRSVTSSQGLANSQVTLNRSFAENQWVDLGYQLAGFIFPLVPVLLVFYLLKLNGSVSDQLGLSKNHLGKDSIIGLGLTAAIGIPGIALYLLARANGLAAEVVIDSIAERWWEIPILLLNAAEASILEETIAVGFLFIQLRKLGAPETTIIFVSATLRAIYHLYQGFAGLIGNFLMGIIFGYLYSRLGRLTPLLVAHFLMDVFVFIAGPVFLVWIGS